MTKEEIIKIISTNKGWYNKSYAAYFFGIHQQGMALSFSSEKSEFAFPYGILCQNLSRRDHMDWFWDTSVQETKRNAVIAKVSRDPNFADSFFKRWKLKYDKYVHTFDVVSKRGVKDVPANILLEDYSNLFEAMIEQGSLGYVVDILLTDEKEDWMVQTIKRYLGTKATDDVIHALTAPTYNTFSSEYEINILRLAKGIGLNDEAKVSELTKKISEKYFWIKTNYLDHIRLTAEHVMAEAEKVQGDTDSISKKIEEKEKACAENVQAKKTIFNRLKVPDELKRVINMAELTSFIQDRRKECVLRHNYLFFELLEELASRAGEKDSTAYFYLTEKEIFSILAGSLVDWNIVRSRMEEGVVVFYHDGVADFLNKKEIDEKLNIKNLFPDLESSAEIRGTVAFMGMAQGVVHVLRSTKDINTFKNGEILVANQTTPEFIPAMKKAAAIITDQGGITSHAAIIARELKVPCIIGTKIGTKVLKDGDLVEVNANEGSVKIIKKANG